MPLKLFLEQYGGDIEAALRAPIQEKLEESRAAALPAPETVARRGAAPGEPATIRRTVRKGGGAVSLVPEATFGPPQTQRATRSRWGGRELPSCPPSCGLCEFHN
jgi:hypothetical protein